jgi:two-component system chemotaxis sensor kinase CheA
MNEQDSMLEIFIYENQQLLETLEDVLLQGEKEHVLNDEQINEVFRIMHTIKGSAAMMSFDNLAKLSHAVEDLFSQIREKKARRDDWNDIFDIVLSAADILKSDIAKIQTGQEPDSESTALIEKIHRYLKLISHHASDQSPDALSGELTYDDFDDPDAPFYKL